MPISIEHLWELLLILYSATFFPRTLKDNKTYLILNTEEYSKNCYCPNIHHSRFNGQKMQFCLKDFFGKWEQIHTKIQIC